MSTQIESLVDDALNTLDVKATFGEMGGELHGQVKSQLDAKLFNLFMVQIDSPLRNLIETSNLVENLRN